MTVVTNNRPLRFRSSVVLALVLFLLLGSCADQTRPTVREWQPKWQAALALLPEQPAAGQEPEADLCNETLSTLRSMRPELSPTPDRAIDDAVQEWFQISEDAFFECPPRSGPIGSFADAYAELLRLEAEINLVLGLDS